MKRYVICFSERENPKSRWDRISDEEFDDLSEAKDKFFKVIPLTANSINSVSMTLIDRKRMEYEMPDEEILSFTHIVD